MHSLIPAYLDFEPRICCHYHNRTAMTQVLRINDVDQWYLERVVKPDQEVLFEAPSSATLEIYCNAIDALPQRLPCRELTLACRS